MRILLTSALTLVLVSLVAIAAASATGIASASNVAAHRSGLKGQHGLNNVAAPPADAPKIDPSSVKFLLVTICNPGGFAGRPRVYGIVARGIDLSEDLTARQLLQMGITFGQEKCPSAEGLVVLLRPGDPGTFTNGMERGFPTSDTSLLYYPSDVVEGGWRKDSPGWIDNYSNFPRELKDRQLAEAAQVRQRDAALEQQRQAAQRIQSEIAARSAAFVKANGVRHFVSAAQLAANPFVYQGQVVAIYGDFEQMNSATQGLFSSRDKRFVVSGIPTARFTQQRRMVMLAGRVLGNIEVKLPVLGPTLVPHLSFVGSAFCRQPGCSDYAFNLK